MDDVDDDDDNFQFFPTDGCRLSLSCPQFSIAKASSVCQGDLHSDADDDHDHDHDDHDDHDDHYNRDNSKGFFGQDYCHVDGSGSFLM